MSEPSERANRRLLLAYAEGSRDLVAPLREAFEAAGFDVASSSDAQPPSNDAIDNASTVVVCWTPAAVASDVVNLQAARAHKARKLVGVLLAPSAPPANLGRPLADLSGWRGDSTDREFLRLVHALHARLSGRIFSSDFWRSRYLSWGGLGAATLGAIAIIANLGDLGQTIDNLANPAASQRDLNATNAKVEEVLSLLKQKSGQPLSGEAEAAVRESIERLLSAQSGARGRAAERLAAGDLAGAQAELRAAAEEGEKAVAGLAETWSEVGALAFLGDTFTAMDAYARVVQLTPDNTDAMSALGSLYLRTGRLEDAEDIFNEMNLAAIDDETTAIALGNLGVVALSRGDLDGAEQHLKDSLELNARSGNRIGLGKDLNDLGEILRLKGDLIAAERNMREALKIAQEEGDKPGEANAYLRLGGLLYDRGRSEDAIESYERSRLLGEAMGDPEGMAAAINSRAGIEIELGLIEEATANLMESLQLSRDSASRESEAYALGLLGEIAEQRGRKGEAINNYRDALMIYRAIGITEYNDKLSTSLKRLGATPHPEGPEN